MKKLSIFALIAFIFPFLSPILGSFHVVKKYTYISGSQTQDLHFQDISEPTASIQATTKGISTWKRATATARFAMPQNMFTLKIPKTFTIEPLTNPIRITLTVGSTVLPLTIDLDGDGREEDYYYTEPVFLSDTAQVSYTIETQKDISLPSVSLIGLDTDANTLRVAFGTDMAEAI